MMTPRERVVLLVVADRLLTQQVIGELVRSGGHYQVPIAANLAQARERLRRVTPLVMLVEDAAINGEPLDAALGELAQTAPVVAVVAPERQEELASLVAAGSVDFVARAGAFLPLAVSLLVRRAAWAEQAELPRETPAADSSGSEQPGRPAPGGDSSSPDQSEIAADLAEILRHEVNNPLTGILGNAELLLARRERLPAAVVQRLETIAELAVRLRETVRRLSNAWDTRRDHARSA